ncbi:MAG: DPP IV N-terminal domain-containing protein, partial [Bryobacteraceae bacterium]
MPSRAFSAILIVASLPLGQRVAAQKRPITIEVATGGGRARDNGGAPVWRPDGKAFAFERADSIWLYDLPAKSEKELLPLGPLRNAATRETKSRAFDWQNRHVQEDTFQWTANGAALLIVARGDLFLWHAGSGKWDQLTATPASESDPKLSPDGRSAAFLRDHDLYTLDLATGHVTRLTSNGTPTLRNGELDWVYPEELELGTAFWWSPDSRSVAYLQFDTSREPLFPHADLLGARAVYEPERYPRAGDPNPDVRLGMVPANGGPTLWFDTGETRETSLIARVAWNPDSRRLLVERLNRVQNRLDLLAVDTANGAVTGILQETDSYWINVHDDPRFLKNGEQFLWSSERDGYRHLYLYSIDGKELKRLTKGDWEVTEVAGVDETNGLVYYLSSETSPLERQFYSVKLNGKNKKQLSNGAGTHEISMSPACDFYLDTFSSVTQPPSRVVYASNGAERAVFREADRRLVENYDLPAAQFVTVKASDGTQLDGRLMKPADFQAGKKYPAIVVVYGGPQAQAVRNEWAPI